MADQTNPPIADVHYTDACESAKASLLASLRAFGFIDLVISEEVEGWAADVVDAVWPILHGPAYADGACELAAANRRAECLHAALWDAKRNLPMGSAAYARASRVLREYEVAS